MRRAVPPRFERFPNQLSMPGRCDAHSGPKVHAGGLGEVDFVDRGLSGGGDLLAQHNEDLLMVTSTARNLEYSRP